MACRGSFLQALVLCCLLLESCMAVRAHESPSHPAGTYPIRQPTTRPAGATVSAMPGVAMRNTAALPAPAMPSVALPTLPPSYELRVSVHSVFDKETYDVRERERDGQAHHSLHSETASLACIFDTFTNEGFTLDGMKCGRQKDLPQRCFSSDHKRRPYVSVAALMSFLSRHNASVHQESLGAVEVSVWSAAHANMSVEAAFSNISLPDDAPGAESWLTPLYFSLAGDGSVFLAEAGNIELQYRVLAALPLQDSVADLTITPPGVLCPIDERKYLPKLANQFTLTMETVIENLGTIAYEHQSYDSEEKFVSYTYRPHLHAQDMMFVHNVPRRENFTADRTYRVVHDFRTGVQYIIDETSSNCSIEYIPLTALDATLVDNQTIRLRHASELISLDPNSFIYKGTRKIRGILCDVWIADRGTRKGQYSTVEIYFTHDSWSVEFEVLNSRQRVPVGLSSYVADVRNMKEWSSVVHTFFYEYSDNHPSWDEFDVSPCLKRINSLFLLLTLNVPYSELAYYNLEIVKNSIRNAIASIAGVSPLRITDLFLSSRPGAAELDVVFVLLEKPNVVDEARRARVLKLRPQLLMADAYKLLHDVNLKHNVSIKLDLSPHKKLIVTIKCGSLETTSGVLHPSKRHKSLRFVQAGYTAGSMAGLGFSMAILGTCVGIFIGFLLWKHSSAIPYQVTD
ncbi:uncharacterized protein LOC108674397 [Hyalella azteca]|uniref:Uncharacterized protein LOC108674397 n=1 Tax=Hyalella azteca TaxID=294128 RepID=A0A8B7NVS9_HYAAZ|nr:uncharacterized protein LOC108674397 [Hyalella azteca]